MQPEPGRAPFALAAPRAPPSPPGATRGPRARVGAGARRRRRESAGSRRPRRVPPASPPPPRSPRRLSPAARAMARPPGSRRSPAWMWLRLWLLLAGRSGHQATPRAPLDFSEAQTCLCNFPAETPAVLKYTSASVEPSALAGGYLCAALRHCPWSLPCAPALCPCLSDLQSLAVPRVPSAPRPALSSFLSTTVLSRRTPACPLVTATFGSFLGSSKLGALLRYSQASNASHLVLNVQ